MRLVVALLTCDRFRLTRRTVDSLLSHNDLDFTLLHADDHSTDPRIQRYVQSRGFKTILSNDGDRVGVTRMTAAFYDKIAEQEPDDTPVLYLQDDFESRRPIPMAVVEEGLGRPEVGWTRLFYAVHKRQLMQSLPLRTSGGERFVVGDLGYSDQPHVARLGLQCQIFQGTHTEGGVGQNAKPMGLLVAVPCPPVMVHIGRNRPVRGSKHGIPRCLRKQYLRLDGLLPPPNRATPTILQG